jgi:hypothetical protein
MISGSFSLPSPGFFSPFPHGTGSLSVIGEYLALEGGPSGFRRHFTCAALLGNSIGWITVFVYGPITLFGASFQRLRLTVLHATTGSRNPWGQAPRFRLIRFRSPLLTESSFLSSPPGTEMFHFPGYGIQYLFIQYGMIPLHGIGLLHSETSGSTLVCSSPKLIAAYRVLHRLPMPRHPSCALSSLTTKESFNTSSRLRYSCLRMKYLFTR